MIKIAIANKIKTIPTEINIIFKIFDKLKSESVDDVELTDAEGVDVLVFSELFAYEELPLELFDDKFSETFVLFDERWELDTFWLPEK